MKFSLKLLLCTLIVMAIGFGFSGYYFVVHIYETMMDREILQALDENSILRFALETAALNVPAKYDVLQDTTVKQIGYNLEQGGHSTSRLLRISNEDKDILYISDGFTADKNLLMQTEDNTKAYQVIKLGKEYYIQTSVSLYALDRTLYLETMKDVSEVFNERAAGFSLYRRIMAAILLFGMVTMYLISFWLSRPIRLLTKATRKMAYGEYDYRAKKVSNDELGQLTNDFNKMANSLEETIVKLEEEVRSREDFMAVFAHELKTPLTAIIGYADILRSHKLKEEQSSMSANYIYTEGKRLEAMSFRLLDIMVTKRVEIELQVVSAEWLINNLSHIYAINENLEIKYSYDEGLLKAEPNLIQSVLVNLLDNACKASEPRNLIEVSGKIENKGYRIKVRDYGVGIPEDELNKITKAFYMVDKSRSRKKNGAGLGLALCEEILKLHNSILEIESELGKGTCISFVLENVPKKGD